MIVPTNESVKAVCLVVVIAETEPCEYEKNVYCQFPQKTHSSNVTLHFNYVSK